MSWHQLDQAMKLALATVILALAVLYGVIVAILVIAVEHNP